MIRTPLAYAAWVALLIAASAVVQLLLVPLVVVVTLLCLARSGLSLLECRT